MGYTSLPRTRTLLMHQQHWKSTPAAPASTTESWLSVDGLPAEPAHDCQHSNSGNLRGSVALSFKDKQSHQEDAQHRRRSRTLSTHRADTPASAGVMPAQQRVATWLEKYHSSHGAAGEGRLASGAERVIGADDGDIGRTRNTAVGRGSRRLSVSLSEASLGDFLKANGRFRPKFLDRRKHHHQSNPLDTVEDRDISLSKNKAGRSGSSTGRQVGWVAGRLNNDSITGELPSIQAAAAEEGTGDLPRITKGAMEEPEGRKEVARSDPGHLPHPPQADGDAEFLSHAFHNFAAFHPLDFAAATAATTASHADDSRPDECGKPGATEGDDVTTQPPRCASASSDSPDRDDGSGSGGIWSYIASMFDDFARDVTFIQ
ncbi:hypothetical protein GQ54DRAFT_25964 [Martensiomyces pterosporus]|nr:hypothetical protein GQ54DRAFT_25964 [Martensiomyces pterosporus]